MEQKSHPKARPFLSAVVDFKSGRDTPRAFLERMLEAIEEREREVQAFVALDVVGARAAADASGARLKAGRQLSKIDGMPIGIKDIIETIDMPTGHGSPLFTGQQTNRDSASVKALREAGCVILGKTVTTEFAATEPGPTRNPWDLNRTPGGSSSGSAAAVAAGFCSAALGTQVVGSILRPASYCGVVGYKPSLGAINRGGSHDALSQSVHGVIAARLEDAWQVAREIADRAGGDPGYPGLFGPDDCPPQRRPKALVLLETEGWSVATSEAKSSLEAALVQLRGAGLKILTRANNPGVEATEQALQTAMMLTRRINAYESRWPLNTYRERDASKLSKTMLERLTEAEEMTLTNYRALLAQRESIRACYAHLAGDADACVALSAPGAAPVGLQSTGNPAFVVAGSLLGVPALSLPLMQCESLPLGLQLLGFRDADDDLFSVAAHVWDVVGEGRAVKASVHRGCN